MKMFSYYITTHFIYSNKNYNSCRNSHSVYQTYLSVRLTWLILLTYFTIQLIFATTRMGFTALFGTIHRLHYIISVNFYLYLQYFQQKVFSFNKISESQTNP